MSIAKTAGKDKGAGFFCVSPEHVEALTKTDTATFCAYIILSCGTGGDNSTTAWSANAVATYAGCRWGTASKAIIRLQELGIIEKNEERSGPKSPKYRICGHDTKSEDAIWLPKTLVMGVAQQAPFPLENLRSTHDPLTIRLLLSFYENQNLIDSGGVDPSLIWEEWTGEKVGESGPIRAWRFKYKHRSVDRSFGDRYKGKDSKGKPSYEPFWERLSALEHMGLVESHRTLKECAEGEPLAIWGSSKEEGSAYYKLNTYALNKVCAASIFEEEQTSWVFPVIAHIKAPVLHGGVRLKFRPHTKRTAAWWAQTLELNNKYLNRFGLLPEPPKENGDKAEVEAADSKGFPLFI